MNGPPTFERVTAGSLERHRQIHFFLERLDRAVEALDDTGADAEPLRRLPAMLDSLRERFEEHNQDEEEGGLLQCIVDALPEVEEDVLALSDQHDDLTLAIHELRRRAAEARTADIPTLRADIQELLRRLREHERAEDALVERAITVVHGPPN